MSKLKELRLKAEKTQKQVADECGINQRTLQMYEQGRKVFDHARIDTLIKVCLCLGCRIEDILENHEYINLIRKYNQVD